MAMGVRQPSSFTAQGYYQDNLYGSTTTDNAYFHGNEDNNADGYWQRRVTGSGVAYSVYLHHQTTPQILITRYDNFPTMRGAREEDTENQKSNVTEVVAPDREQYNKEDFPVDYANAKFFVIKSYGEDDVHKSIKYNVWASTLRGNKKLDAAYEAAQQKPRACPVFLFFSVNTSRHFVGLSEMTGRVEFDKNVDYWQQDKWKGSFPLRWHIVKDVPNSLLKHIILDNRKRVTRSRDTEEVMLEQGKRGGDPLEIASPLL
ncbi:hypothetical protein Bca52824_041459 [Brassica carinata]|uniref:YTH domain-containing family protein n=1 Tax=Brassica carinata TaxID=52824 RepID=A0A8X7RXF3_BRACI|nr:hypothetical protein Bca52824_041459 [Brassica carinata]